MAAYRVGKAYMNSQNPLNRPDIPLSVSYLNRAAASGNLNAVYWLGVLMEERKVMVKNSRGELVYDTDGGHRMRQLAAQNGYVPATDSVTPQRSQSTSADTEQGALIVGAALLLGFLAMSQSGATSSSTPATGYDNRTCVIPMLDMSKPSGRSWFPAYGSACDNPEASAFHLGD